VESNNQGMFMCAKKGWREGTKRGATISNLIDWKTKKESFGRGAVEKSFVLSSKVLGEGGKCFFLNETRLRMSDVLADQKAKEGGGRKEEGKKEVLGFGELHLKREGRSREELL